MVDQLFARSEFHGQSHAGRMHVEDSAMRGGFDRVRSMPGARGRGLHQADIEC